MTALKDRVSQGLSEIRNLVLGVQILLGFQYDSVFQSGFRRLSPAGRALDGVGMGLLSLTVAALLVPITFNRLAENGGASGRQEDIHEIITAVSLAPFAVALGLDVFVALSGELTPIGAAAAGTALAGVALLFWYGGAVFRRRASATQDRKEQPVPLKDRINALLTESRIVLPGVQALLGFQLVAYFTDGFQHAPADARLAHGVGLVLLILAMILLMTPAAFHRLAEHGEDTPRVETVCAALILTAMTPLGFAIGADLFVVCRLIGAPPQLALLPAGVGILLFGAAWYLYPLSVRSRRPESSRPSPAADAHTRRRQATSRY